jgi:c-di-GMP-binding flagellar brake protein YcgR
MSAVLSALPEPPSEQLLDLLVHAHGEKVSLLRALEERHELVSVYYGGHDDFMISDLIEIGRDERSLLFSLGRDEAVTRRLFAAPRLVFVARVNQIKIQFDSPRAVPEAHASGGAFRVPLPPAILRLQRRDGFRVRTPASRGALCSVRHPERGGERVALSVVELSNGGIGAYAPLSAEGIAKGSVLEDGQLILPGAETIPLRLEVRHLLNTGRGSRLQLRLGMRFIDLAGPHATLIQRYINQLERQNLARI